MKRRGSTFSHSASSLHERVPSAGNITDASPTDAKELLRKVDELVRRTAEHDRKIEELQALLANPRRKRT